jgi:hypothetical protein
VKEQQNLGQRLSDGLEGDQPLREHLLWGVAEIAKEIDRTPRQAGHLLECGFIPAKKVGRHWCSSRAALRKHFAV